MFTDLRNWLQVLALALVGLFGLFLAAKGETQDSYVAGLVLFFAAVIGTAYVVRRAMDQAEKSH